MILLTKGADVNAPWTAKEFDRMPSVHRVRWIDAEGNGRKMVVNAPLAGVKGAAPDYRDKVGIYAYNPSKDYQREVITEDDQLRQGEMVLFIGLKGDCVSTVFGFSAKLYQELLRADKRP